MRKSIPLILIAALGLGACGTVRDSGINPLNWFGRGQTEPSQSAPEKNPLLPEGGGFLSRIRAEKPYQGRPFEQVSTLTIEQVAGGAIIRATGIAARQGIYAVQLTPAHPEEAAVEGVLTYRLEGILPDAATAVGSIPTREVIAARYVTDQTLAGVTAIRVEGQSNAQVARR